MSYGLKVSLPSFNADEAKPNELSFTSEYYMHSIGQTEFRELTADTSVHHFFPYIPIIISYYEDINNLGEYRWADFGQLTGANATTIRIGNSSGDKVRYYALYQGI